MEIAEQRVQPEQADQAEVAHHLVERLSAEFSGDGIRISSGRVDLQLLVDVALVHHRVENVQNLEKNKIKF